MGAARRHARTGRDARGLDPPPPSAKVDVRDPGARGAARLVERSGRVPGRELATAFLGIVSAGSARLPGDVPGIPSTACRRSPSTTARSSSPAASGCGESSPTRMSASPSRRRPSPSELRDLYAAALGHDVSATNLKRVLLRRNVLEATGRVASRDAPAGGLPRSTGSACGELEITDPFATLRPPG